MNGIKIEDLRLNYHLKNRRVSVLNGINLLVDKEEITVILGKSGCGKTSLLRCISGLETTYKGEINFQGIKLGYVFQEPRLMPWLNLEENILFVNDKLSKAQIAEILSLVGLADFSTSRISHLSGGMQSRAALARVLAYKADFILMDEPFASLDYFTRRQMQKQLKKIHQDQKLGILLVTHDIDEALILGDRILLIDQGVISLDLNTKNSSRDILSKEFIENKSKLLLSLEEAR